MGVISLLAVVSVFLMVNDYLGFAPAEEEPVCESCDSKDNAPVHGEGSAPYNCGLASAAGLNSLNPPVTSVTLHGNGMCTIRVGNDQGWANGLYNDGQLVRTTFNGNDYHPPKFHPNNPFPLATPSALCDGNQLLAGQAGFQVAKDNAKADAEKDAKEACKCDKDACMAEDSCKLKENSLEPSTNADGTPSTDITVEVTGRDSKGKCTSAKIDILQSYNFECEGACIAKVETAPIFD